jgi:hypothetical protein
MLLLLPRPAAAAMKKVHSFFKFLDSFHKQKFYIIFTLQFLIKQYYTRFQTVSKAARPGRQQRWEGGSKEHIFRGLQYFVYAFNILT